MIVALIVGALLGGSAPFSMADFAPPTAIKNPTNHIEGRLVLAAEPDSDGGVIIRDGDGAFSDPKMKARRLPPFDVTLVQSGTALIPVQRGSIAGRHPHWELIVEPGRIWGEPGDSGFSRASLPFALEERNANCIHNGVLSFRLGADGRASQATYLIASETCAYSRFDLWGRVAATYIPEPVADAPSVRARYAEEIAHRIPIKPIATLASDYRLDPSRFGAEIAPADMTIFGVVVNGIHYSGGCETRRGRYPFCAEMDLPSYSLAKSLVGGLAAMRAELLYPGNLKETIAANIPACAAAGDWEGVTLADVLNMATGHYQSPDFEADEAAPDNLAFLYDETHTERIASACNHYPNREAPGQRWVYHTSDSYLLGSALQATTARRGGGDFYDSLLVEPVWHGLHLDPAIDVMRRSYDAERQPFTGWGLTLHGDDIAKLATFITRDHGVLNGISMVAPKMLTAALQQDPRDPGLPAGSADFRYKNGFWAWNAAKTLGCREPTWIPFLSGYGGIIVALIPNGVTYYYVSDGGTFAWSRAVKEAAKISPVCAEDRHGA